MRDVIILLVTALLGAVGFALLFCIDLRHLPFAAAGGMLAQAAYMLVAYAGGSALAACLVAAAVATIFSEICAKRRKTPATVFLLPSLIPLVPGSSLYYTMSSLINGDYAGSAGFAIRTASVMLGLSGGVMAASLAVYAFRNARKKT